MALKRYTAVNHTIVEKKNWCYVIPMLGDNEQLVKIKLPAQLYKVNTLSQATRGIIQDLL